MRNAYFLMLTIDAAVCEECREHVACLMKIIERKQNANDKLKEEVDEVLDENYRLKQQLCKATGQSSIILPFEAIKKKMEALSFKYQAAEPSEKLRLELVLERAIQAYNDHPERQEEVRKEKVRQQEEFKKKNAARFLHEYEIIASCLNKMDTLPPQQRKFVKQFRLLLSPMLSKMSFVDLRKMIDGAIDLPTKIAVYHIFSGLNFEGTSHAAEKSKLVEELFETLSDWLQREKKGTLSDNQKKATVWKQPTKVHSNSSPFAHRHNSLGLLSLADALKSELKKKKT